MFALRLSAVLLAVTSIACSGTSPGFPVDDLDFAEVRSTTGWRLRIHGDGSARLRHISLPAHYLHYPTATFDVRPARKISRVCDEEPDASTCVTLRYYTAFTDEEVECPCTSAGWPTEIISEAITKMSLAVEGEGTRVSRRMMGRLGN